MTTLSRRPRILCFAALFLLTAASGCFVTVNDGPGGSGGAGGDSSARSSASTGSGQGGSGATGSSSSAGNGGAGGSGGGGMCVGPDGTGQSAASCDLMEITPSTHNGPAASNCDPNGGTGGTDPPPGYSVCIHGFTIFTAGSAENLRACLGQINGAPATACDFGPVNACITKMYNDACPSQLAADTCQLIKDMLCVMGEAFDVSQCADDMKPFNSTGMQRVADCITMSPQTNCQAAYDTCLGTVLDAPVVP
jgi:hypothetical protein